MKKKTLLAWSSGKDCAWALHLLRQDPEVEVVGLFSLINKKYGRVSMHGTRLELVELQAEAAALPFQTIELPDPCPDEEYGAVMEKFVKDAVGRGVGYMAFGDLYLEEVRQYREARLEGTGIVPLFPLWGIPTDKLAEEIFAAGFETYISSVDLKKLPAEFAGRRWSRKLLSEFPPGTDPCGENGEFHTVVVAGPNFNKPIPVKAGEIVERNGFAYADIIPS